MEYCIHHIQINMLNYHKDSECGCNIFSKLLIEQNTGGGGKRKLKQPSSDVVFHFLRMCAVCDLLISLVLIMN